MGARNPYDVHIGSKLRAARVLKGISQTALGESVGLSFQQIQKYEKGLNRIGGSRLQQFSEVLGVPVASFFEGIDNLDVKDPAQDTLASPVSISQRKAIDLVRYYSAIKDDGIRENIYQLIRAAAAAPPRPASA